MSLEVGLLPCTFLASWPLFMNFSILARPQSQGMSRLFRNHSRTPNTPWHSIGAYWEQDMIIAMFFSAPKTHTIISMSKDFRIEPTRRCKVHAHP